MIEQDITIASHHDTTLSFTCPFEDCTERLPTERSLRAHIRDHRASSPIPCKHLSCDAVFPTMSERNTHIRLVHADDNDNDNDNNNKINNNLVAERITAQIADDSRFDDTVILNSNRKRSLDNDDVNHDDVNHKRRKLQRKQKQQVEEQNDIREIADNAAYLVSQMRDAWSRNDVLANWNSTDVRNFHQWGIWVEDSVNDLKDSEYTQLKRALQKRDVNINGLFKAEQAVMYALLGDNYLNEKRLSWILQSIVESNDRKNPFDAFVKVATECMRRNRERHMFETCEHLMSKAISRYGYVNNNHNSYFKKKNNNYNNIAKLSSSSSSSSSTMIVSPLCDVEAEAKGALLAKRIIDGKSIPKQGKTIDDVGWGCIMLWAAYAMKTHDDNNINTDFDKINDQRNIVNNLTSSTPIEKTTKVAKCYKVTVASKNTDAFWANTRDYAASESIWTVPAHILTDVCAHDFGVMDGYLSKLLDALNLGRDRAAEAGERIRALSKCHGRVGWLTKIVVQKFSNLTGITGLLQFY